MTFVDLVRRAFDFYTDQGTLRTAGTVVGFCGRRVEYRSRWLAKIVERDRGRGYPLRLRLHAARHGRSAYMYHYMGLEDADLDQYLTLGGVGQLNRNHVAPLHDKYTFHLLTEPYVDSLPRLYGLLEGGTLTAPLSPQGGVDLVAVLERAGKLVLKPTAGGKGKGVTVLEQSGTAFLVNGSPAEREAVADLVAGLDGYIVTEFVQQHAYAEAIFPDATNTIRIHTIVDPDTGAPSVFRPVHRFGSAESAPTDNGSRGGYAAPVDERSGAIGRLVVLDDPPRSRPDRHPETGSQVQGVTVPYWEEVCELVRDAATLHRRAPLVGWDVVVTEDGPVIIEGNAGASPVLLQLERGLFEDRRVRRLFGRE